MTPKNICIVGGCGHVGLPLGIALASRGHLVKLIDLDNKAVSIVNDKKLPFLEEGAEQYLENVLGKNLFASSDMAQVKKAEVVFFVTGTPVDEHHNPRVHDVIKVVESYLPYLSSSTLIILRSTVYPGVIDLVDQLLFEHLGNHKLAFCPERIVQGKGIEEIFQLPQIVSATSQIAEEEASALFATVAPKIIPLKPEEAELAKLMTNSWRYLEFAIANQFYMMAEAHSIDFYRVLNGLRDGYERAAHFARPGLTAGPCLFKDTMQLAAFHKYNFFLGHSAMLVNEGMPIFLVDQLEKKLGTLKRKKVAILGMTFKPNNDDIRESLSFKLKKILEMRQSKVLPSDPFLKDLAPVDVVLNECDAVILGVPHQAFLNLKIDKPFIDCWGVWQKT